MPTLIISEKNKAAQAIAEALGKVQRISEKNISIYHVQSQDIYVIPLRGHIQQYENTAAFKKWSGSEPREIITNPSAIAKIPSVYSGSYISALKKYAKLGDICIIGTDADVEGCNIGLLDAFPFVKSSNPRIKISFVNDIIHAYEYRNYDIMIS